MKTSKKVLALVLAAVLLVGASVMGTIAYLTSTDEVNNTFTVGDVKIKLDEALVDDDGKAVTGEDAERVKANDYKLLPGHTYDKDPTVTVLKGSEESYVRLLVTVNKKAALDKIGVNTLEVFKGYDSSNWTFASQNAEGDTMVYEFRYKETVTATDADVVLDALFDQIVVPGNINNDQLATLDDLTIDVVAQAIQADGFTDDDAAWTAFSAS